MLSTACISVALCESEVNDINEVLAFSEANNKIVGLDIAVEKVARVYEFNTREHLVGEHEDSFEGELASAVGE